MMMKWSIALTHRRRPWYNRRSVSLREEPPGPLLDFVLFAGLVAGLAPPKTAQLWKRSMLAKNKKYILFIHYRVSGVSVPHLWGRATTLVYFLICSWFSNMLILYIQIAYSNSIVYHVKVMTLGIHALASIMFRIALKVFNYRLCVLKHNTRVTQ